MSRRKGLVLLFQMRSEIDGRVSIGHRLSVFCSVDSGQWKVQMRAVQGECSNKVLKNRPFWVISSPLLSNVSPRQTEPEQ